MGEPGSRGLPGKNGLDGEKGMEGEAGMKGDNGMDGTTGQMGERKLETGKLHAITSTTTVLIHSLFEITYNKIVPNPLCH